eukprot:m.54990 g.54990  ORF g.54990 m.54990 type:complete len:75 (+) comp11461_c1_seq1:172-396(+)
MKTEIGNKHTTTDSHTKNIKGTKFGDSGTLPEGGPWSASNTASTTFVTCVQERERVHANYMDICERQAVHLARG